MKILIIGNGYLGKRCAEAWGDEAVLVVDRVATVGEVLSLLDTHQPDVVLNAAGVVGKPNVDWCEDHQLETIIGNTVLPITIATACAERSKYLLHMATGCVYYGYSSDPNGWKESDPANPSAVYTHAKYAADLVLSTLPNVGIARIRMPIDCISVPQNLINKLVSFSKVADVINSATVVEDMIAVFHQLLEKKATGIFHVTNPGAIRHREILEMYQRIVDATHTNAWITEQELVAQGLAVKNRSNTILQSENLGKYGISMRPIREAVEDALQKYSKNIQP
jgi:3,5-epimerase/4-reductase